MPRFYNARFSVLFVLLFLTGAGLFRLGEYLLNPDKFLPNPETELRVRINERQFQSEREIQHITLESKKIGEINFTLSLPSNRTTEKIPLVIVLGGLGRGEDNLRYISYGGANAIAAYDWPLPVRFPKGKDLLFSAFDLRNRLLIVPAQVVSMINWLSQRSWIDAERISISGFSLGALAVPSVQIIAAESGIKIGWTVLAYGGVHLGDMFHANSGMEPKWLRKFFAFMIDAFLMPLEPLRHLPKMKGEFLVIEGEKDRLVPGKAQTVFRESVPHPKTVITFAGDHIGLQGESLSLLKQVVDTASKWLIEKGAVNP